VGNRLYVLGGLSAAGQDFTLYDDVQFAPLGNDGGIPAGSWAKAKSFPTARSGLGAVAHGGYLYIAGGFARSGTLSDVQFAPFNKDGSLGDWVASGNKLMVPRSNHRLEVITTSPGETYLAAIAGVGEIASDTVHFDHMEVAQIAKDGSVGPWRMCPFHLKGGRSAPATVISGGVLYVLGGWGDLLLSDVFSDVQFAAIRPDGCVDPWRTNPYPLNIAVYGHTSAVVAGPNGNVVLALGGNAGNGNYFANVQMATLTPLQATTRWYFSAQSFAVGRWGHVTVLYNDLLYVIGGAQRSPPGYLADVQLTRVGPAPTKN
jgi:hypothetical protein